MPEPITPISGPGTSEPGTTSPAGPRRRNILSLEVTREQPRSLSTNLLVSIDGSLSSEGHGAAICTGSTPPSSSPASPRSATKPLFGILRSTNACAKTLPSVFTMAPLEHDLLEQEKTSLLNDSPSGSSLRRGSTPSPRLSEESTTTVSTTSLVFDNLDEHARLQTGKPSEPFEYRDDESDPELPPAKWSKHKRTVSRDSQTSMSQTLKRLIWIVSVLAVAGWAAALFSFISNKSYQHGSTKPYDHQMPGSSSGHKITLESVQQGSWYPNKVSLNWIAGPNGEDGLLLETTSLPGQGKPFMVVEDVRGRSDDHKDAQIPSKVLMESGRFTPKGSDKSVAPPLWWPSPDLTKVLLADKRESVYRHSFTARYYIFDVETQTGEFLDEAHPDGRVQLATWSPQSNAVVFTRDNDLFVRILRDANGDASTAVRRVTDDGGPEYFYGIPDWVYEEEVLQDRSGTWWARDGKFVAFMRTNDTVVSEYPLNYFVTRPGQKAPEPGLEAYPEEVRVKYPKAGSPNPVVDMLFYDLEANEVFDVKIDGGFDDDDRIIADVLWADDGKIIIKEVNRVYDKIRVVLVDVNKRSGKTVRTLDVAKLDGGWVEPGEFMQYVPADPANGRPFDGYVDLVIYDNGDHIGYFSPIDQAEPLMLTKGEWEVDDESVKLDLTNNLVYFTAAKEHSTQRHIYSVDLSGNEIKPIVQVDRPGYYSASFSTGAGYAIVDNNGPGIPSQMLISTPSNNVTYEEILEENKGLAQMAARHEMPHLVYSNFTAADGTVLNVVERRPPHFDPKNKYPVLFQLYGGPGSQSVNRKFQVDFQSYVASSLGYVVVTLDNRGTGFIGRKARTIVREHLGYYEAIDQIACGKEWSKKSYVDPHKFVIWGWSYGGFMTLKVLETDAGETFKFGIAVAPVTDWRFYDTVYTERYMLTPQLNPQGYENSAITKVAGLSQVVHWLLFHGTSDDNVHFQNSLALVDKLDSAGVTNFDQYLFPDSDHSILVHNGNNVLYTRMSKFLMNIADKENNYYEEMKNPTPPNEFSVDDEDE